MAILKKDCISISYEEGTIGGNTYYVAHPSWEGEKAICFRLVKDIPGYKRGGMYCQRQAGHGTDHVGEGACVTHGGTNHLIVKGSGEGGLKHGRRAKATRRHLSQRVDDYMQQDHSKLLDLRKELITIRLLFQDIIDMFPDDPESKDYALYTNRVMGMVNAISNLVDRMSRIETRNTITASQVLYIKATVADILMRHITDPRQRDQAVAELMDRLPGGDVNVIEGETYGQ